MAKVRVSLRRGYVKVDGTSAVVFSFYINRKRVVIPTGVSVSAAEWDDENSRVRGNSRQAKDANLIISNVQAKINDVLVRFRLSDRTLTRDAFFKMFRNEGKFSDFWEFFAHELEQRRGSLAENTYRAQKSTLKKFMEVIPELPMEEVNHELVRTLRQRLSKIPYNNAENTINKNLITLKTYVLLAQRAKLVDNNPFEVEKIRRAKGKQVWLTEKELLKLVKVYTDQTLPLNLHHVLQYFLFSCFTGMRLSDVKAFDMDQIKGSTIVLNPVKTKRTTNELVTIPITKPIRRILNDAAKHRVTGRVFDCLADAATNRYLKRIAAQAGIAKDISFHSARHTFATVFLERTDDLATLQKLLGHSSIGQTMVYVHLTEKKKAAQMHRCWDNFF